MALMSLGALGVVYGDIGTSPLYALRECFHRTHAVALTETNVYGVLSSIVWALGLRARSRNERLPGRCPSMATLGRLMRYMIETTDAAIPMRTPSVIPSTMVATNVRTAMIPSTAFVLMRKRISR